MPARTIATLVMVATLGACQSSTTAPGAPTPGLWQMTQSTTPLSGMPGVRPQSSVSKACLKADDLDFVALLRTPNADCRADDLSTVPGRVHARISCRGGKPEESGALVAGTTTAATLHIEMTTVENVMTPDAKKPVRSRLKVVVDGQRIGDCPAL